MAENRKVVEVPKAAVGLVIGKKGSNLNKLKATPGIISVQVVPENRYSERGQIVIRGTSNEAVEKVCSMIENIVINYVSRGDGHHPPWSVICCATQDEEICAEGVRFVEVSKIQARQLGLFNDLPNSDEQLRFFACFNFSHTKSPVSELENLTQMLASSSFEYQKSVQVFGSSKAGLYADHIGRALSDLKSMPEKHALKFEVKLGKHLLYPVQNETIYEVDLDLLKQRLSRGQIRQRFVEFKGFADAENMQRLISFLKKSGYAESKISYKISSHVVDLREEKKYHVTLQPKSDLKEIFKGQGELNKNLSLKDENIGASEIVTGFRSDGTRHGFVTFLVEKNGADYRLAMHSKRVRSEGPDAVVKWVKDAYEKRKEGFLDFDLGGSYRPSIVRYKETVVFVSKEFKMSLSRIASKKLGDGAAMFSWEASLKSLVLKQECCDVLALKNIEESVVQSHLQDLVKEALKLSLGAGPLSTLLSL